MAKTIYSTTIAEIDRLASTGLGYEDIAVKLCMDWRDVRPFVLQGRQYLKKPGPPGKIVERKFVVGK